MKSITSKLNLKILTLLAFILILACQKDEEVDVNGQGFAPPSAVDQMKDIMKSAAPKVQKFSMKGEASAAFIGAEGVVINIPANAFVDKNGNPVTGLLTVSLKEVLTPGAMILEDKPTESNGRILVSGGELYLRITQGGNELRLADGKSVEVRVPTDNFDLEMGVFTGVSSDGNFTWVPAPNILMQQCGGDSTSPDPSYCFGLDTLFNWINCDYFMNDPRPLTDVVIDVPGGFDNTNTLVFVHIPSTNSLIKVTNYSNGVFAITNGYRLPVGMVVNFVSIHADIAGNYFVSYQNNTITQGHVENLNYQFTFNQAQLVNFIQSL